VGVLSPVGESVLRQFERDLLVSAESVLCLGRSLSVCCESVLREFEGAFLISSESGE